MTSRKSATLRHNLHLVGRVTKFFDETNEGFKGEDFEAEAVVLSIGFKYENPGLLLFLKEGQVNSCVRAVQKYKQESGKEKVDFYRNGRCTLFFEPGNEQITVTSYDLDPVCKDELHLVLSQMFPRFEVEYKDGNYKHPHQTVKKSGTLC